jgi:hypothetical protein
LEGLERRKKAWNKTQVLGIYREDQTNVDVILLLLMLVNGNHTGKEGIHVV